MFNRLALISPYALAAAIGITFLQTAAFAAPAPGQRSIEVSIADLNLANPADVTRLDSRLARAARAACEPADARNLSELSQRPACEASALAAATPRKQQLVAMSRSPQVAGVHAPTGASTD